MFLSCAQEKNHYVGFAFSVSQYFWGKVVGLFYDCNIAEICIARDIDAPCGCITH